MTLAARLAAALAQPPATAPIAGDEVEGTRPVHEIPAAVLIAVTDRPRPGMLLTLRASGLRAHGGQVAFPGGRIDAGDASAAGAALREAQEEIALDPACVEIVGQTDPYLTVTGYRVIPVVAVVPPDLPLRPSEAEVAALFEAPLDHLLDPANIVVKSAEWRGRARAYREIMWRDRRIWGATAAMIANLSARLAWTG